jgi:hypothetical protein
LTSLRLSMLYYCCASCIRLIASFVWLCLDLCGQIILENGEGIAEYSAVGEYPA